jgi:Leucine-rich repeat (LRR) protein
MPVSFNLRDKSATMHDRIDAESLRMVQRMLDAGEISELGLINIDIELMPLLNLSSLTKFAVSKMPCFDLGFLSSIKKLQSLRLGFMTSPFGKKIRLDTIPRMDTLTSLSLSGVRGLQNLPALDSLKKLVLMSVTDEDLAILDSFPAIRDVFISGGHLEGYNKLLHCKNLERLIVIQSRKVDFAGISADGHINHSLKILELSNCPSLTGFDFLKCFTALKYMDITSCNKLNSFQGIENCPNLEVVNISECKVSDKTLKWLTRVKKVLLGISYKKDEVQQFEKEFRGEMYSIGKFDKGRFDYLDHYTKYYSKDLD